MTFRKPTRRALIATGVATLASRATAQTPTQAPAAQGFPSARGGKGGRIIRVTTLKPDGPGSFIEAVGAKGPRIVVFEVGGVIDLGARQVRLASGDLTIAGQTAPSPGVTFIRGGMTIGADQVVIQHVAVRPGEAGHAKGSGWECDGISSYGAADIRVENCSLTWATDENLSASGKRFEGATLADWRQHTSHRIHFRRNIVAEGLSKSTHSKGEHSKGSLIHDNVRNALIEQSLYAHNMERNVLFKGGAQGVMRDCLAYNGGRRFAHYNLHESEWEGHAWETGDVAIVGNTFLAGPSTDPKTAAFMLGGEGPLDLTLIDNLALDAKGAPLAQIGWFGKSQPNLTRKFAAPRRTLIGAPNGSGVRSADILAACGARPWDRDPIDARIVADATGGTGRIIDSEQDVGGYPLRAPTHAPFQEADWDLSTMTRKT